MNVGDASLLKVGWLPLWAASMAAQGNFVYTNNDQFPPFGPNSISAFSAGEDGVLTEISGSPFSTGGWGGGGGYFASNRVLAINGFLYASNADTNDVSAFAIDGKTGSLTPVPGSPFPTAGTSYVGFSLAATPDGRFLYATQDLSTSIRIFQRDAKAGILTPVGDLVYSGGLGANSMKVSPDGTWLALVLTRTGPHGSVAMFRIDSETGRLTSVPGSPFRVRGPGGPDGIASGLDINCAGELLFIAEGAFGPALVDVLSVDSETLTLTPIEDSPFLPEVGEDSVVAFLSLDDSLLFVSNVITNDVTVFTVAFGGSLSVVPGSPFRARGGTVPSGMATDPSGVFLYLTEAGQGGGKPPSAVDVFNIGSDGVLTEVPEAPFSTHVGGAPTFSLTAYPGKTCPSKSN